MIAELNKNYTQFKVQLASFTLEFNYLQYQKKDKTLQILQENRIIKNEVLDIAMAVDQLREMQFVQHQQMNQILEQLRINNQGGNQPNNMEANEMDDEEFFRAEDNSDDYEDDEPIMVDRNTYNIRRSPFYQ